MLQSHRRISFSAARAAAPGGQPFSRSAMLELEFAELSDPGKVRGHNEDYIGHAVPTSADEARSRGWLFALADGVGGEDRGEVASRTAIESLLTGFRQAPTGESYTTLLPRLIQGANTHVHEAGLASKQGSMTIATTLVACTLRFDR